MSSPYLLDNAAAETAARFRGLSALYDATTFTHLQRLGVGRGAQCLEVAAGGGSVARWLADRVGETGQVTATDIDVRWLTELVGPGLDVVRHDVTTDPLPRGELDLIHTRLLLGHLPDWESVLRRLVPALRPGGWLLVEELDVSLDRPSRQPHTEARRRADRVRTAFTALLRSRGCDLELGSAVADRLCDAGCVEVGSAARVADGDAAAMIERANVEQTRAALVGSRLVGDDEIEAHLAALATLPIAMPSMVSTWARRPGVPAPRAGRDG